MIHDDYSFIKDLSTISIKLSYNILILMFGKSKAAPANANPILNAMMTAGQPMKSAHISKDKMKSLLDNEFNP